MQKRFSALEAAERATLEAGRCHHPQHQFRARCQGLLWSADGPAVPALAGLLGVQPATVRAWFTRWETGGLAGLANASGQGRPAIPGADDADRGRAAAEANRQQLKAVTAGLRQELAKDFSPLTLKRFLKSVGANGGASATT